MLQLWCSSNNVRARPAVQRPNTPKQNAKSCCWTCLLCSRAPKCCIKQKHLKGDTNTWNLSHYCSNWNHFAQPIWCTAPSEGKLHRNPFRGRIHFKIRKWWHFQTLPDAVETQGWSHLIVHTHFRGGRSWTSQRSGKKWLFFLSIYLKFQHKLPWT